MLAKKTKADLTDKQLLRYNRHIVLPEIDIDGQTILINSKVAIIGLGGLGCPVSTYLASSGLGTLLLIDDDTVSLTNLNRQTLFTENDLNKNKVDAASKRLLELNSDLIIKTDKSRVDQRFDTSKLKEFDVIVDCRLKSSTYGAHFAVELSAENHLQLLVPKGFAHGFLTLSDIATVNYKVDDYYHPECDAGIAYNDPDLGIDWPLENRIISEKDLTLPNLKDLNNPF